MNGRECMRTKVIRMSKEKTIAALKKILNQSYEKADDYLDVKEAQTLANTIIRTQGALDLLEMNSESNLGNSLLDELAKL